LLATLHELQKAGFNDGGMKRDESFGRPCLQTPGGWRDPKTVDARFANDIFGAQLSNFGDARAGVRA